jgi:chromosome segregation ATPase
LNSLLLSTNDFNPETQVSLKLQVVDNVSPGVDYYTILNNRILHLRSEKSIVKSDGFYIAGLPELQNPHANKVRTINIFTLEEALKGRSPLPLYSSIAEATNAKNELKALQNKTDLEIKEHERKLVEIKRETELLRTNRERAESEKINVELELKNYRAEQERISKEVDRGYELRMKELKEQSDKATMEAKKQIEFYKVAVGVIGFGLVIAKLI